MPQPAAPTAWAARARLRQELVSPRAARRGFDPMGHAGESMVAFLGVAADPRLLNEDLMALPASEQRHDPAISTHRHDRLVAAGSLLTGATLIGGGVMTLYGGGQALFNGGGAFDVVLAVIGILLVATHWGWVHV